MKFMLLLFSCFFSISVLHASPCMPYNGEILTFSVGWEFINAGSATMTVSEPTANHYRIQTLAKTNKFLDIFKKVRDSIISEGVCMDGKLQSTRFELEQHERKYHAKKTTIFDSPNHKVYYTQNEKTDTYDVSAGHINVIDAFFMVRSMPLQPGDQIKIPVFDSRKTYEVEINVGKRTKRLHAPWGKYVECILIQPRLKTEGIFSSNGSIRIWVTNDKEHIPIKLIAKIKIGHILGTLTYYKEPS